MFFFNYSLKAVYTESYTYVHRYSDVQEYNVEQQRAYAASDPQRHAQAGAGRQPGQLHPSTGPPAWQRCTSTLSLP